MQKIDGEPCTHEERWWSTAMGEIDSTIDCRVLSAQRAWIQIEIDANRMGMLWLLWLWLMWARAHASVLATNKIQFLWIRREIRAHKNREYCTDARAHRRPYTLEPSYSYVSCLMLVAFSVADVRPHFSQISACTSHHWLRGRMCASALA